MFSLRHTMDRNKRESKQSLNKKLILTAMDWCTLPFICWLLEKGSSSEALKMINLGLKLNTVYGYLIKTMVTVRAIKPCKEEGIPCIYSINGSVSLKHLEDWNFFLLKQHNVNQNAFLKHYKILRLYNVLLWAKQSKQQRPVTLKEHWCHW